MGGCVRQLALTHVNQESEVPKEVCTDDGLLDISDNEYPRRRPRLRVSERVPYVGMDVLFTAVKDSLSGGRLQSEREGGISDPVSTRKRVPVTLSTM